MKVQCDVCEKAPATVICCADEAALCASCDVEIHAANKLASKHQRLLLQSLSNKLPPRCDICREKPAFIFCVEDRALFCQECDEPIHVAGTHSGNHQRYLATGILVALSTASNDNEPLKSCPEPPSESPPATATKVPVRQLQVTVPSPATATRVPLRQQQVTVPSLVHSAWAVDDLFDLSDYEYNEKKGSPVGFEELDWFTDIGVFNDQMSSPSLTAAEVPDYRNTQASNANYYKASKSSMPSKRPRMDIPEDDFFIVPDLG